MIYTVVVIFLEVKSHVYKARWLLKDTWGGGGGWCKKVSPIT